ncbi:LysR family transcriptional regulator [Comamonas terrigena]|uniref:LysR family transcriptional regulator n=1 Tax=Comamonas terrigena TaxID=32013 RepID=UPI00244D5D40|nr:LysR family transcriptional regulator [Comamonas terrigena]MDH0051172.1 LysR family transcriptional regulator [Comamonas terrigena]MDH0513623.1 LysR family transcriptional regulator [Comamonas terrigena]MDH1093175.1 LysR family transcriptional regulator [Comamonas terrigena]MDH1499698.1 LysR family transcriptional regulator [Comamonas terrigena]
MEMPDSQHTDELATLLALSEQHSFAAAARVLERHPSVLSKRIQALERRLGVRLVERTTRRLSLTREGLQLVEKVRQAASWIRDAEREAAQGATEVRGRLRLALPAAMGRRWISPMVAGFALAYPEVVLEVEYSERIVDVVGERFDVAIRIGNLPDSGLVATRLCDQYRILCASAAYLARCPAPASPADLARHNCLGYTGLLSFPEWTLVQADRQGAAPTRQSLRVTGSMRSNDNEALLHAALQGVGIVAGSDWHLLPAVQSGALVRVLPEWTLGEAGGIYLVRPSGQYQTAALAAFRQWISERFAAVPWRHAGAS